MKNQDIKTSLEPGTTMSWVSPKIRWILILIGAVFLIFGRSLWFPPELMDDMLYIRLNTRLDFTWANFTYWWHTPILGLNTPLQMYSYMLDHLIWGEKHFVFGVHLHSLLLHLVTVIALFGIGRECGMKTNFAGIAALLFAIHPQRIESVVWLSERKDVLAMALVMMALWLFLFNLRTAKLPWLQAVPPLLFAASLLSKPMAILFPLIILAFLWRQRCTWDWRFFLRHSWAFFAVMLVFQAMRTGLTGDFTATATSGTDGWNIRLAIIANNFGNYFIKTFYPYALYPVYPFYNPYLDTLWPAALFGIFCGAIVILAWRYKNYSLLRFELLPLAVCFAAALIPVVGIVRVGNTDFADRYSYFAAAFLWLGMGLTLQWLWTRWPGYHRLIVTCGCGYVLIIGIYSWNYLACWQSGKDYMSAILDHPTPNHRLVYKAVVDAYGKRDFEQMHQMMDGMLKIYPHFSQERREEFETFRLCMTGMELFAKERPDEGIVLLEKVTLTPRVVHMRSFSIGFPGVVMSEVAVHYLKNNRKDLAAKVFQNLAVTYQTYNTSDYHFFMGMSLLFKDDLKNAEQSFLKALEVTPGDENITHNLEAVRRKMNATPK